MAGEDTVYNDLEKLKESGWGCYIPWVDNHVAAYGNLHSIGVVLWGGYLAHYLCVHDLFSSVCSYIFISNGFECFSSRYLSFLEAFVACSNPLADTY